MANGSLEDRVLLQADTFSAEFLPACEVESPDPDAILFWARIGKTLLKRYTFVWARIAFASRHAARRVKVDRLRESDAKVACCFAAMDAASVAHAIATRIRVRFGTECDCAGDVASDP